MFVTSLEFDAADGSDEVISKPSWSQAVDSIRALDGEQKDNVCLDADDDSYMGIAGGRGDEYVVAGFLTASGRFILACGEGSGAIKHIPVCGDENPFCDFEIVNQEVVLEVAKTFFERGICDPGFKWNDRSLAS